MAAQYWMRNFVIATLAANLLYRTYFSLEKLLEWRIGSSEMPVDADEIMLPSVTFCMLKLDGNTNKSENITADYNALPKLEDVLAALSQRVKEKNE